jgi:hypothetical protein
MCNQGGLFLLATTTSLMLASGANNNDISAVVDTHSGPVEGVRKVASNGKPVDMYWGIPFAQPPLGHLRFRAPRPVKK